MKAKNKIKESSKRKISKTEENKKNSKEIGETRIYWPSRLFHMVKELSQRKRRRKSQDISHQTRIGISIQGICQGATVATILLLAAKKNKLPPPPPYHQHVNDLPAVHGEEVQQKHLQSPTDCEKKLPLAKLNSNKGNLVERNENSHNLERVHKVGKPQR